METRCQCGARLYEGADWCTQCYEPVGKVPAYSAAAGTPAAHGVDRSANPFSARPVPVLGHAGAEKPWPAAPPPPPAAPWPAAPPANAALPAARPLSDGPTWSAAANAAPVAMSSAGSLSLGINPAPVRTQVDTSVFRTAFGVIVLGAVVAMGMYAWGRTANVEPTVLIRDGLYVTIGLYALVMALVVKRAQTVSFRPVWTEGDPTESLARGLLVGAGLAAGLMLLSYLAAGHVVTDSGISVIVSERTITRTLAAFLVACVAAPWVEELLFRGLLTESLRPRGMRAAATGSGILFALWHPQALFPLLDGLFGGGSAMFFPFLYYVSMGSIFARLYMRRGLKCSIAAHTAFNGVIVLAAVLAMAAPSHVIASGGVTVDVPATWHLHQGATPAAAVDLVADGPSGANLLVMHLPLPPGANLTADQAAARLSGGVNISGVQIKPGSQRTVDYPMGRAARVSAKAQGHAAEVVLVPKADVLWEIILTSGGSDRASHDFDQILRHVTLP